MLTETLLVWYDALPFFHQFV